MSNTNKNLFRVISLLVLLVSFIPISQPAQAATALPPVDMFQLPWDQGVAWVAIDGFDDGSKRLPGSPHNYHTGGAVDFAPRAVMFRGEDTSNFWVTAAANGTIVEISKCHMKIAHANGWITEYQHLANIQVELGDVVARNQRLAVIANASSQPVCPGSEPPDIPHLHFTLRPNMVGATFAGWEFKYNKFWNTTTFAKDGKIVTLYKPLLNVLTAPTPTPTLTSQPSGTPTLQTTTTPATSPATITPGGPTNTPDLSATATPTVTGQNTNTPDPSLSATPTPFGQNTNTPDPFASATSTPFGQFTDTPDPFASGTPTPFQNTNTPDPFATATPTPFGQFTNTPDPSASATPTPYGGSFVSTTLNSTSLLIGGTTLATVSLHNVPAEGYTSAEFTCTFDAALVEVSNITTTNLFGADVVAAVNAPQAGTFILAIAGSNGNKATTSGDAFTFDVKALQAGQTTVNCTARVSTGNAILTPLPSSGSDLVIFSPTPTPTWTPTPVFTPTPTSPTGDWLTFTNVTFGFQFMYPPQGQIEAGSNDGDTIIRNLPIIQPGTNLSRKYLEVAAGAPATECKSLFPTQDPGVTVTINGIDFLKQTGLEGAAGNIYQWVAFSTLRNGVCVSVNFVLHSQNPDAFPTPPPTYDYATETAIFDQIIGTYMWLAVTPTATPTGTLPSATPVITDTPVASPTAVAPTSTPTISPTSLPTGMISGQVIASKPVTIDVYDAGNVLIASVSASLNNSFAVTLPAGTYTVVASADGCLNTQGLFSVTSNMNSTLPTITLQAGDIDNNNVIDQFDALTIGMNYNAATPSAADLNNDGVINVLDLEALAKNYREIGPAVWQ